MTNHLECNVETASERLARMEIAQMLRNGEFKVVKVTVEVECLRCGHKEEATHSRKRYAEGVLNQRGWQTRKGNGTMHFEIICPACLELREKGIWTNEDIDRDERIRRHGAAQVTGTGGPYWDRVRDGHQFSNE